MPSPLNIPKKYSTDDAARLKDELERLAQEVDTYLRQLVNTSVQVPLLSQVNPSQLSFGQIARANVPDGYTLSVQLPPPHPANIGKRCGIRRASTTGEILVYPSGFLAPGRPCLVAGAERYRMANDIHFVEFLFDGDYYPSRAGGGF